MQQQEEVTQEIENLKKIISETQPTVAQTETVTVTKYVTNIIYVENPIDLSDVMTQASFEQQTKPLFESMVVTNDALYWYSDVGKPTLLTYQLNGIAELGIEPKLQNCEAQKTYGYSAAIQSVRLQNPSISKCWFLNDPWVNPPEFDTNLNTLDQSNWFLVVREARKTQDNQVYEVASFEYNLALLDIKKLNLPQDFSSQANNGSFLAYGHEKPGGYWKVLLYNLIGESYEKAYDEAVWFIPITYEMYAKIANMEKWYAPVVWYGEIPSLEMFYDAGTKYLEN